jgi:lipopolysaccharide transport system ATP-binding protein
MDPVISVEGLGKRYRLGRPAGYRTLREELSGVVGRVGSAIDRRATRQPESFWALRDVSFEIQAGQVVGMIGANGAGKSTLLKILSRITKPSSGQVQLRGRVSSLLEVGTGFHPELTGRENIYLNGAILGMRRAVFPPRLDDKVAVAQVPSILHNPGKP